MVITKKALSRRTFLQASGVTLALPFLGAMSPALAAKRALPQAMRMGFFYVPNGIIMEDWLPPNVEGEGSRGLADP